MGDLLGSLQVACERGQSTPKKLVVICGVSRQTLKLFLVTVCDSKKGWDIADGIRFDPRP